MIITTMGCWQGAAAAEGCGSCGCQLNSASRSSQSVLCTFVAGSLPIGVHLATCSEDADADCAQCNCIGVGEGGREARAPNQMKM